MNCTVGDFTLLISGTERLQARSSGVQRVGLGPRLTSGTPWWVLSDPGGTDLHLHPAFPECRGYFCTQLPRPKRERGGEERREGRERGFVSWQ